MYIQSNNKKGSQNLTKSYLPSSRYCARCWSYRGKWNSRLWEVAVKQWLRWVFLTGMWVPTTWESCFKTSRLWGGRGMAWDFAFLTNSAGSHCKYGLEVSRAEAQLWLLLYGKESFLLILPDLPAQLVNCLRKDSRWFLGYLKALQSTRFIYLFFFGQHAEDRD